MRAGERTRDDRELPRQTLASIMVSGSLILPGSSGDSRCHQAFLSHLRPARGSPGAMPRNIDAHECDPLTDAERPPLTAPDPAAAPCSCSSAFILRAPSDRGRMWLDRGCGIMYFCQGHLVSGSFLGACLGIGNPSGRPDSSTGRAAALQPSTASRDGSRHFP
jgi:hypothetical protein